MWEIEPPLPLDPYGVYFGFDPGTVNLGWAVTYESHIRLFEFKIVRDKDPVERTRTIHSILVEWKRLMDTRSMDAVAVIEGASYGDRYRQVELAEQRAVIMYWMDQRSIATVKVVPPISIRKAVFGSIRVKPQDVWDNSEIPDDALAALSCLYYAIKVQRDKNG